MKHLRRFLAVIVCCLLLWIPALALSGGGISGSAAAQTDGSCQVEMTVIIRLDSPQEGLTFPLDGSATDILLNGHSAPTSKKGNTIQVSLPGMTAGQHTFVFQYTLPNVIKTTKEGTVLQLPLLCGFSLEVDQLDFRLTLPGPITGRPAFQSGYYQENIRLHTDISENTLVASTTESLKDHETLMLVLPVEKDLFHVPRMRLLSGWGWATVILLLLAAAYYVLTMLPRFFHLDYSYTAPEGITAGDVGCCLTGSGTDLGMMVLSWAQLGYLQLELDRRGRLLLHQHMDMGHERNLHEFRIIQNLFARRNIVDATGRNYARLYRKVAGFAGMRRQMYVTGSGDARIFQVLACAVGLCGMVDMASSAGLWLILLVPASLILSFVIQYGCKYIPLRNKLPLVAALGCGILWIFLGSLLDATGAAVLMVIAQLVMGILGAFGGKRTQLGQRTFVQLVGLWYHMLTTDPEKMQKLQEQNPDYFYEMIPYAMAMGIERQFARRFGKKSLPGCLWLKDAPHMNTYHCAAKMRQIANILDKARYAKV